MSDRAASYTAQGTAYLRAAHQLLDAPPLILEDPCAIRLLGPGASQRILGMPERYQTPGAKALRSQIVLRSRFAEDRLAAGVQRGVKQYAILGAGFDTFALRQPAWAASLSIFEIDQPATQTLKRARLAETGFRIAENVTFVQADFEREALDEILKRDNVSPSQPTLFSWLGVTMYLNEAAIDATLQVVAAFPSGSELVLTFLQPPDSAAHTRSQLAQRVTDLGEPFVSYFTLGELEKKLLGAGFMKVRFLSPEDAYELYYRSRPDDLPAPQRTGIAYAIR